MSLSRAPERSLMSRLPDLVAHHASTGIVTDVDGTICPIVARPDEARVADKTRHLLADLTARFGVVALVSGRSVDDVLAMVPLPEAAIIGNHGMERLVRGVKHDAVEAESYRSVMGRLAGDLAAESPDGVIVQPKGLSVSLHYRLVADPDAVRARLLRIVGPLLDEYRLRLQEGRRVIDLRPDIRVDKGTALAELVEQEGLARVVFFGDDVTDVAAFDRLREMRVAGEVAGFSVAVASDETDSAVASAADYVVPGPDDVIAVLEELSRVAKSSASLS